MEHRKRLDSYCYTVNAALEAFFEGRGALPQRRLFEAMEYSLCAGGKRIRPVLCLEFCRICGGGTRSLPFATAIEMVHCYSLIHDDLPAMDDDELRRGRPTNHRVYGEATAILAGDALLTEAFSVTAGAAELSDTAKLRAVRELSSAAGACGMVGGQQLDIENRSLSLDEVKNMHGMKTGALIRAAARLGVIAAGGDEKKLDAADRYSAHLGLAFQIKDDLLDIFGDTETLGKTVGVDLEHGKNSFPAICGVEECSRQLELETELAKAALQSGGFSDDSFLIWLADYMLKREK